MLEQTAGRKSGEKEMERGGKEVRVLGEEVDEKEAHRG